MKYLITLLFIGFFTFLEAQETKKVLFIGNSYTSYNNLPDLVKNIAAADGNILDKDASSPGGYFLNQHAEYEPTLQKIASKNWDMVVLQDQSQIPSFPWTQVQHDVFPYAEMLVNKAKESNACVVPLFYATWGRKNGDQQWDSINTFEKMNNRLYRSYAYMANTNEGMLSPVGMGFQYIKQDINGVVSFPELYVSDGSHPSLFGSYLAACIFNNIIFSKLSSGNTYLPNGVSTEQAVYLQNVADYVVYLTDSIRIDYRPLSNNDFDFSIEGNKVILTPVIEGGTFDFWDFGDGNISEEEEVDYSYSEIGTYTVKMVTSNACYSDTIKKDIVISTLGLYEILPYENNEFKVFPNPSTDGALTVDFKENEYTVFSILGNKKFSGKSKTLHLNRGIYFFYQKENTIKVIVY